MVTVEFGGRVVNADTGDPVPNVRVSRDDEMATSGEDGRYTLTTNLRSDWRTVILGFTGPPGYDDRRARFEPTANPCRIAPCWTAADRPDFRLYPTLVIRPGESIEVRIAPSISECGFLGIGFDCRRVRVEASMEPVELEIVTNGTSLWPMGLVESDSDENPVPRLTVVRGVVYVYGVGTGTLTARR